MLNCIIKINDTTTSTSYIYEGYENSTDNKWTKIKLITLYEDEEIDVETLKREYNCDRIDICRISRPIYDRFELLDIR